MSQTFTRFDLSSHFLTYEPPLHLFFRVWYGHSTGEGIVPGHSAGEGILPLGNPDLPRAPRPLPKTEVTHYVQIKYVRPLTHNLK